MVIPFMQQILDIPQRPRIPDVHHHGETNDLRRRLEVAENAGVVHAAEATHPSPGRNPIFI